MKYTFHIVDVFSSTPLRITESCSNRTIIVIIMNLWHFRFGINTSATFVEEALWKISSPICVTLREHL
jgi:hypothetical protein